MAPPRRRGGSGDRRCSHRRGAIARTLGKQARRRRVVCLCTSYFGSAGASRDVIAHNKSRLELQHMSTGLRARCLRRVSRGRVLGTCLRRVLTQRPPRLDRGCLPKAHRLIVVQSAHHPGIRHERALVFTSSVSYSSNTLRHDSQGELCSKSSDSPAAPSQQTRRERQEPCVASSRSSCSQMPR